jgi:hypothetical protein
MTLRCLVRSTANLWLSNTGRQRAIHIENLDKRWTSARWARVTEIVWGPRLGIRAGTGRPWRRYV